MGLMSKLRAELIDIIEWVDDSRHTLVWRYPRYQNEIKYGAQLIVRPGQQAVFVRQGKIADIFDPGHYELETRNLPVLSTLSGWKYGFHSPFKAEVYFVSTRQITDLKWGTPNPVMLRDPDFGPVRVRAFGTYALKALVARTLLEELVGADAEFDTEEITELLRSIIGTAFADVIGKADIPILELASRYRELSEELRHAVIERVDDEYGLEIPQLNIVNVSLPAEVEQAVDARSSMGVIGDLQAYQQYQLGQAMPIAAENPGGGLAGAGLGMGMGVAMAAPMVGPLLGGAAPGQAPQAQQTPPPLPTTPVWHVARGGQSQGPFSQAQLAQAVAQGALRPDTPVWMAGMAAWVAAGQLPQLAGLFAGMPPPPPPPPES